MKIVAAGSTIELRAPLRLTDAPVRIEVDAEPVDAVVVEVRPGTCAARLTLTRPGTHLVAWLQNNVVVHEEHVQVGAQEQPSATYGGR